MTDIKMQDVKLQDRKYSVNRAYIALQCAIFSCCYFLDTNTNALCVSYYLFRKGVGLTYYLF